MNIFEYCEIIDEYLVITYDPYLRIWRVNIQHADIKDGGWLVNMWGSGKTIRRAIEKYIDNISGRVMVTNANTDIRKEHLVPTSLEIGDFEC
jgi:hypothetical protein